MRKWRQKDNIGEVVRPGFEHLEDRLLLDAADLAVTDIFRDPAQPEVGQVVTLVATVVNDSNTQMGQDFYADFTADGVSLTSGTGFLVKSSPDPLGPGEKLFVTMDYVFNGVWPVIGVQIDMFDQVAELAEGNNSRTENFSIPSPDLGVVSLTHGPDYMAEGDTVTFTGVIENMADAGTVRNFTIGWYVNRGGGWELFDSELIKKDFNVGTQLTRKISFPAEYDLTQVKLSVDINNDIDEVNEWNNDGLDQLIVAHSDLVVSDIRLEVDHPLSGQDPQIPWDGQEVTFYADIANIAAGGTKADFSVRFIMDYGMESMEILGDARVKTNIAARAADVLIAPVTVSVVSRGGWVASPGEHTITVIVDADNEIPERYEFNNAFSTVAASEAPVVSSQNVTVAEPLAGIAMVSVPLLLDNPSARSIGLYYQCEDGTAIAGIDYVAAEGVINIAAGQSSGQLGIQIIADGQIESPEVFYVRIYGEDFADCPDTIIEVTITDSGVAVMDDVFSTNEDEPLEIPVADLLTNDIFPDSGPDFYVSAVGETAHASVWLLDSVVYFVPDPDFEGLSTFEYYVYDGQLSAAKASISVNVLSISDPPIAQDDSLNVWTKTTWPINVLTSNDSDSDGDWLTVHNLSNNIGCSVSLIDGNIVFVPDDDFLGTASFDYTVIDPSGLSDTAHVSVEVVDYLDYLAAQNDPVSVSASNSFVFLDADGQRVTVSMSGPGEALVYFDRDVQLYMADPKAIKISGSTAKTTLKMRTKGSHATTTLGCIRFDSADTAILKKLDIPDVVLDGDGLSGGRIDTLKLGDLSGDADIVLSSSSDSGMKIYVYSDIGDWDTEQNLISVDGRISLLKADSAASDVLIEAQTVGKIKVADDFAASVTLTDSLSNGRSLDLLKAGGVIAMGQLDFAGIAKYIKADNWWDAEVSASEIGKIVIAGDMESVAIRTGDIKLLKVKGDMVGSSLSLLEFGEKARVLVSGWIADTDITCATGLKQLKAGGLDGVDIVSGYTGVSAPDLDSTLDLLDSARILKLNITASVRDVSGRSVTDSRIVSGSFGKVKIDRVELSGSEKMLIGAADWDSSSVKIRPAGQSRYSSLEELTALGSAESPLIEIF